MGNMKKFTFFSDLEGDFFFEEFCFYIYIFDFILVNSFFLFGV